jgi:hypothetical protein
MRNRMIFSLVCRHCGAPVMAVRLVAERQLMKLRDHVIHHHPAAVRVAVLGVEETMRHFEVAATVTDSI